VSALAGGVRLATVLGVIAATFAGCALNPGTRSLPDDAAAELCETLDALAAATAQPNAEAAGIYRAEAETLDDVIADTPSSSLREKARISRLRAIASASRLASIHAEVGDEAKRREAERDLATSVKSLRDCS